MENKNYSDKSVSSSDDSSIRNTFQFSNKEKSSYYLTVNSSDSITSPSININKKINQIKGNLFEQYNKGSHSFYFKNTEKNNYLENEMEDNSENERERKEMDDKKEDSQENEFSIQLKDHLPNYEIKITGYVIKNVIFQHVKYVITVTNPNNPSDEKKIYRRYSEFVKLRELLIRKYIGVFIPTLPFKEIFVNKDISLIEFRKKFLQIFMHELQVIYFFNESEEIRSFLDPQIEIFPPENLYIITKSSQSDEDYFIQESLFNTRKKLSNNYVDYYSIFLNTKLFNDRKFDVTNLMKINYKALEPKTILENIKKTKYFKNGLINRKRFLEKIQTVLKDLVAHQKESTNAKCDFTQELRNFQNNFIFAMNENINVLNYNSEKSIQNTNNYMIKIEEELKVKKTFDKLLKNMNDWIYKEITIIDGLFDTLNGLDVYKKLVLKVNDELKWHYEKVNNFDLNGENSDENQSSPNGSSYNYLNFDVKEKLERKFESLKEIIAINYLFLNEIEMNKYKSMRFIYFYNSLKFAYLQNQDYMKDNQAYFDSLMNIITTMKMYLNNNSRYKMYFQQKNRTEST